ncbi:iron ABC transporter permease, partial [Streptococcus pneumoniae]|nr:iron ABC transporter permease [Streptococcus pneumoniae]
MRYNARFSYIFGISLLALVLAFVVSMVFGAADVSLKNLWLALFSDSTGQQISVIQEIRLP